MEEKLPNAIHMKVSPDVHMRIKLAATNMGMSMTELLLSSTIERLEREEAEGLGIKSIIHPASY